MNGERIAGAARRGQCDLPGVGSRRFRVLIALASVMVLAGPQVAVAGIPPQVVCPPSDIVIDCDADTDAEILGKPEVTDGCEPIEIELEDTTEAGCPTVITRTWTITDDCQQEEICVQTITLVDDEPPVFDKCPADITLACDDDTSPDTSGHPMVSDNCSEPEVEFEDFSDSNQECPVIEVITRVFTAFDECGNDAECVQIITLVDTEAPVITLIGEDEITLLCGEDFVDPGATAEDNCSGGVQAVEVFNDVNPLVPGVYVVVYEACDECGNCAEAIRIVTVLDDELCEPENCNASIALTNTVISTEFSSCGSIVGISVVGTFQNIGLAPIANLFFETAVLTNGNALCNADGGPVVGAGSERTVPVPSPDDYAFPGILPPGGSVDVEFLLGVNNLGVFTFLVDIFGVKAAP